MFDSEKVEDLIVALEAQNERNAAMARVRETRETGMQQCGVCGKVEDATGVCSGCRDVTSLHFFPAVEVVA